jgi:hypothetical protein
MNDSKLTTNMPTFHSNNVVNSQPYTGSNQLMRGHRHVVNATSTEIVSYISTHCFPIKLHLRHLGAIYT